MWKSEEVEGGVSLDGGEVRDVVLIATRTRDLCALPQICAYAGKKLTANSPNYEFRDSSYE